MLYKGLCTVIILDGVQLLIFFFPFSLPLLLSLSLSLFDLAEHIQVQNTSSKHVTTKKHILIHLTTVVLLYWVSFITIVFNKYLQFHNFVITPEVLDDFKNLALEPAHTMVSFFEIN